MVFKINKIFDLIFSSLNDTTVTGASVPLVPEDLHHKYIQNKFLSRGA